MAVKSNIGRTNVEMGDILNDTPFPDTDMDSLDVLFPIADDIDVESKQKDLFAVQQRKAWDKSIEARCDFSYKLRIVKRSNVTFIAIWQKTLYGRTLTDIKDDPAMVAFFAEHMAPVIKEAIGEHLSLGGWCICTSPKRRHKVKNFATMISERLAEMLGITFYEDVALCHSKHRVNAVFELNVLPQEPNIIVYDDFVTTGSTLQSMKRLLLPLKKNLVFFTNVNNKI